MAINNDDNPSIPPLLQLPAETSHVYNKIEKTQTKHVLYVNEFTNEDDKLARDLLTKFDNVKEHDEVEVRISSAGGYIFELDRIINILRFNFYGRITTICYSHAYSSGACLFLIGDNRIIFENSVLMFHDVSLASYGKHSDVKNQNKFNTKYFDYRTQVELNRYFSKKEIEQLLKGKEFWLDSLDLCKRGIATHIEVFGQRMPTDDYIKYRTNKKASKQILKDILNSNFNLSSNDRHRIMEELKSK